MTEISGKEKKENILEIELEFLIMDVGCPKKMYFDNFI